MAHLQTLLSSGIIMVCLYPAGRFRTKDSKSVLMIRLARIGKPKQPYYRVVVIEKERARNGRPVEVVGTYNPRTNPATFDLKRERIEHDLPASEMHCGQCDQDLRKIGEEVSVKNIFPRR